MLNVILVASGKGGTGKTSLTSNVCSALAHSGKRVLAIDADSGLRNLDLALGLSDTVVFSFADVATGMVSLERAAAKHSTFENLFMLTAPATLPPISDEQLKSLINQVNEQKFDYLFIDGPAGLAPEIMLFSVVASQAIIVTTPDGAGIRGAEKMTRTLEQKGLKNIRLVVNRVRSAFIRNGSMDNIDDVMDTIGIPLLGIVPEDEAVILHGTNGKSLSCSKKTGAAMAFRNIAGRVDGQNLPLMRM